MPTKLTALCLTYNEIQRINRFCAHAPKWADEVIVVDKGSTDGTVEFVQSMGIRVERIGFSRQGYEDTAEILSFATNDWVMGLTPGEVPTRPLIARIRELISREDNSEIDVILFPVKLFSFGVNLSGTGTPWSYGSQPRLYNRKKCQITGLVHEQVKVTEYSRRIPYSDDTFVFHPTHAGFESFMKSHLDYASATAHQSKDKLKKAVEAIATAHQHDFNWQYSGKPGLKQSIAWKIYWYMVALACISKDDEATVLEGYKVMANDLISEHWGAGEADHILRID